MANFNSLDANSLPQQIAASADDDGSMLLLRSNEHRKNTYRYAGTITPVATPTDIIIIKGSASMTGRLKRVSLTGFAATTAGLMSATLVRRSTADSGGTGVATAVTAAKHDITNDATPTCSVSTVGTGNFTSLGTSAGNLAQGRVWFAQASAPQALVWEFATRQDKAVLLRGLLDFICITLNGGTVPSGGVVDFEIEIEEDNS